MLLIAWYQSAAGYIGHAESEATPNQITPNPDSEPMQTTTLSCNDSQRQMEHYNADRWQHIQKSSFTF